MFHSILCWYLIFETLHNLKQFRFHRDWWTGFVLKTKKPNICVSWLYLSCLPHLLPDTDELVALHGERVEPDVGRRDPNICQLKHIRQVKWRTNRNLKDTMSVLISQGALTRVADPPLENGSGSEVLKKHSHLLNGELNQATKCPFAFFAFN
jgi:hypothetical protein